MYTIRLTRALLQQFEPADPAEEPDGGETSAADAREADDQPAPTTRLGDWYVMPLAAGARSLILCTSERSLLSVVLPADALAELPERLVTALVGVLHRLGVPEAAVVAEVDAMTSDSVGAARNRSTIAAMRGLATRAVAFLSATTGDVDVAALYAELAAYRSRALDGQSASERAMALLAARPVRRPRTAPPRRGRT